MLPPNLTAEPPSMSAMHGGAHPPLHLDAVEGYLSAVSLPPSPQRFAPRRRCCPLARSIAGPGARARHKTSDGDEGCGSSLWSLAAPRHRDGDEDEDGDVRCSEMARPWQGRWRRALLARRHGRLGYCGNDPIFT
jgi:hypothetical protein